MVSGLWMVGERGVAMGEGDVGGREKNEGDGDEGEEEDGEVG